MKTHTAFGRIGTAEVMIARATLPYEAENRLHYWCHEEGFDVPADIVTMPTDEAEAAFAWAALDDGQDYAIMFVLAGAPV